MPEQAVENLLERVRAISRENERLFEQLVAGEQRYRGLARAVWRVQEAERRRLARELHDGIGQTLTALKNQLEAMARRAVPSDGPVATELRESVAVAARALAETRELSRLLRPAVLDDLGLVAALRWLARSVETRAGLAVGLSLPDVSARLDPELETLVFRVAQEGLNNVEKHASARSADIALEVAGGVLRFTLHDDGAGFDAAAMLRSDHGESGFGLRGIRDRAELFGGRLAVESQPGQGTVLRIVLPLPASGEPP
jgi:two-component system sensor histidine kinase UhpB